jgi:hypothetical protein
MFDRSRRRAAYTILGAAAVAAALAAPASAAPEALPYPTAIAADAAEMMAKYGGVVIDVESRFAAPSLDYFGCGTIKHETKASMEKRTFNYSDCASRAIKVELPPTFTPPNPNNP